MLSQRPDQRPSSAEVVKFVEADLAAFLRHSERMNRFSPEEEITQLTKYLPSGQSLGLMPDRQKRLLKSRLDELKSAKGLEKELREKAEALCAHLDG
jgi:hypothetical protein